MSALSQRINAFVPMHVYYGGKHPEGSTTGDEQALEGRIIGYAHTANSIEDCAEEALDLLFLRRIQDVQLSIKTGRIGTVDHELNIDLHQLSKDSRYTVLKENMNFAFRVIKRSAKGLSLANQEMSVDVAAKLLIDLTAKLSYREMLATLFIIVPDEVAETSINRFTASLHLDFAITLGLFYLQNDNLLADAKIAELTTFIAHTAQRYGAYSRMMQPKKERRKYEALPDNLSAEERAAFMEENYLLAEAGLQDWANNIEW
ncbi:hypothetical protein [Haliscomenobacter hydrossis]|uniref:Uncharacterized protein n=1 Tax=Haliscomenobacter hydrossis (strain ATCC 27775 / DSM 1100 / LMG 10767 / O) TaxID=760192 RepID=F4L5Q1_HALH1|nr:hypothetical protein [Haliscomenobacter hydrossis]AEE51886.1 hypothetical protein Halhy_4038 [Haliscomenobacter hydrossis DSM 1100]